MGSMAPPEQGEEQQEHAKRGGFQAEHHAPRHELAEMMARLGIYELAEAPLCSWYRGDSAAEADRFSPVFLRAHCDNANDQMAYGPASMVRVADLAPSAIHHASGIMQPPRDRGVPAARRFAEGRQCHVGLPRVPQPGQGAGTPLTRAGTSNWDTPPTLAGISAAGRGVLPACVAPPPPYLHGVPAHQQLEERSLFSTVNEQEVLAALSHETPVKIVSYVCYLLESESRYGQRLFQLVFNHCHHQVQEWVIAKITRDRKSFCRLCVRRTDEVVFLINSCETRRSIQLFRDVIGQWVSPNQLRSLLSDLKRLRVVYSFILRSPPDIAQFIFEVVAKDCVRLACQPNGLSLLQNCLESVSEIEKDYIVTQLCYQSLHLALNSCGNWIIQDILNKGDNSHIEIVAFRLRNHYVALAKNMYGSNVVECCLRVFDEGERMIIINELIYYPHFRDLVTHEFANFTLSTALDICKYPIRNILANAILSQNISVRNQHCTKIFSILAKYGFMS